VPQKTGGLMKKAALLLVLIFCTLYLTGCTNKNSRNPVLERIRLKQEIVVGVKTDSKPFGFIDENGENAGFDVDVAKYIAKSLFGDDSLVKFVSVTSQNRMSKLNAREIDMIIATMSVNSQREEIVDFTLPYYIAGQAIMAHANSSIHSIKDLNYKDVVIVLGSTGENTLRHLAPNARIVGAVDYKDAFEKLKNGEVQAVLADDSLLYGYVMDNKGYKILPKRYTNEYYAIAIEKFPNDEYKKILNNTIRSMQENGTLHRIRQKWTQMPVSMKK